MDNVVFVGKKSVRTYEEAVKVQFEEVKAKEVILRARGKYISKAFNVAEFVKRRDGIKIKKIESSSEQFRDEEKQKDIFVSTVDICLTK